jgi:hypothetical protein
MNLLERLPPKGCDEFDEIGVPFRPAQAGSEFAEHIVRQGCTNRLSALSNGSYTISIRSTILRTSTHHSELTHT